MTAEVRLGDWRETLPGTYDPARAVVITDPPYGLRADGGAALRGVGGHMGLGIASVDPSVDKGYDDTVPWAEHLRQVLDLLPAKRHVIRGPATALFRRDYPQPRRVCVEVAAYRRRAANRPGVVPYLWQGWAVYGRLQIARHRRPPIGDAISNRSLLQLNEGDVQVRRTAHRALTPYASCLWIVDTWADPGFVVIDPFAGHGTIGRAARQLGFDYIGSELVEDYWRVAVDGLASERLVLGLETA